MGNDIECGAGVSGAGDVQSGAVINAVAYAEGKRLGPVDLPAISDILQLPDRFVWVGLHEPSEALLKLMQEEFGLHELAVEDALRAHQRPKLERYGDSLFIVLRTVRMASPEEPPEADPPKRAHPQGQILFGETHFFLGPQYLLSVRHGSLAAHNQVRSRCEANAPLLANGPGFALYALMDFIVDQYFPVVDALEESVEHLEESIFSESANGNVNQRIYELKRDILEVRRAIHPLTEVCNQLLRFDLSLIPAPTRPYFRDVQDHVLRLNETLDTQRELLASALEASYAMAGVAQNEVTKQLAAWAAIIAVPTMIAGIYGMNFEHMPELKWSLGYPLVLLVLFSLCGYLYWRFKKSGWL